MNCFIPWPVFQRLSMNRLLGWLPLPIPLKVIQRKARFKINRLHFVHSPRGSFSGHEKGGKLERVPNEGGKGRKIFQSLVLTVVDLDTTKLLFFGEGSIRRRGYSYASNANKRLQNLKLKSRLVKVNHKRNILARKDLYMCWLPC